MPDPDPFPPLSPEEEQVFSYVKYARSHPQAEWIVAALGLPAWVVYAALDRLLGAGMIQRSRYRYRISVAAAKRKTLPPPPPPPRSSPTLKERVLAILRDAEVPLTADEILAALDMLNKAALRDLLVRLVRQGLVERVGHRYRLNPNPPAKK